MLLCSSCYAGVGPSFGIAGRSPTIGWELSTATVSLGQSFATDSEATLIANAKSGEQVFKRRTYLLWEPQYGAVRGDINHTFGFSGVGGSIGLRWDKLAGTDHRQFGALGGAFIAAGAARGVGPGCDTVATPYVSLSIGARGSEIYVLPKVGGLLVPKICFSASGQDWGF